MYAWNRETSFGPHPLGVVNKCYYSICSYYVSSKRSSKGRFFSTTQTIKRCSGNMVRGMVLFFFVACRKKFGLHFGTGKMPDIKPEVPEITGQSRKIDIFRTCFILSGHMLWFVKSVIWPLFRVIEVSNFIFWIFKYHSCNQCEKCFILSGHLLRLDHYFIFV